MDIVHLLMFFASFILNSIDLSSQSKFPPNSSPGRNSPDTTLSLALPNSSARSPPAKRILRARSRSPPAEFRCSSILGLPLQELKFLRFIPKKNPERIFKFQSYTFPDDKPIQLRTYQEIHKPIPTGQQIVFTMSNGDVFGLLEKGQNRENMLRGLYTLVKSDLGDAQNRVKINMFSGAVNSLTEKEIAESPLGNTRKIVKGYKIVRV